MLLFSWLFLFIVFQIMFHVSTMLNYEPNNPQQIARKKYVGNDLVTIIFQDMGDDSSEECTPFKPPTIVSNMLHAFICVQPLMRCGVRHYRVVRLL